MSPSVPAFRIDGLALTGLADVVHDVVRPGRVATHTRWHMIQIECVADLPANHVIRARRVAAHADRASQKAGAVIEREPAAEYVDASNLLPHERVGQRAVSVRIASVGGCWIHGIAFLQPK